VCYCVELRRETPTGVALGVTDWWRLLAENAPRSLAHGGDPVFPLRGRRRARRCARPTLIGPATRRRSLTHSRSGAPGRAQAPLRPPAARSASARYRRFPCNLVRRARSRGRSEISDRPKPPRRPRPIGAGRRADGEQSHGGTIGPQLSIALASRDLATSVFKTANTSFGLHKFRESLTRVVQGQGRCRGRSWLRQWSRLASRSPSVAALSRAGRV
jgi:hypothetical protein